MGKKYTFADVSDPTLPRITSGRFVHGHDYTHKCVGRGSLGYGHSARQAYERWKRNWERRYRFYKEQHDRATICLDTHRRRLREAEKQRSEESTPEPAVKTYACKRCGHGGLVWQELDTGWRLHQADGRLHLCYPRHNHHE